MRVERMIGILSILLQKGKVTAPYLAERFEVSRRTISRDIDKLCEAGIPILTMQGAEGGISLMEGYTMDRAVFTRGEMQAILEGLSSLDSITTTNRYRRLMDKLSVKGGIYETEEHLLIDLSSFYKKSIAAKTEVIREAIEERQVISFRYISRTGEKERSIEPWLVVYCWNAWYVWGWCLERQEMRMFKLNRILELKQEEERYEWREIPDFYEHKERIFTDEIMLEALFAAEMKWRLIDEYGADSYEVQEDGRLLLRKGFTNEDYMLSWLLGFGAEVEVHRPVYIREKLKETAENIRNCYL